MPIAGYFPDGSQEERFHPEETGLVNCNSFAARVFGASRLLFIVHMYLDTPKVNISSDQVETRQFKHSSPKINSSPRLQIGTTLCTAHCIAKPNIQVVSARVVFSSK